MTMGRTTPQRKREPKGARSFARRVGPPLALAMMLPFALDACAVPPPTGPTVAVMPGKGKSFAAFQADDATCRSYASARTGGASPAQAGAASGVGSALVGTGIGAAAGAAIGSTVGQVGAGAAIGGASGLLLGSLFGLQNASASAGGVQNAYNIAYVQCMSAKGNEVPPPSGYSGYYAYGPYPAYPWYPGYYWPGYYYPY